jgi:hypothetical protein
VPGETQVLDANSPGDWQVVNTTPYHSDKAITAYPNTGFAFGEKPLSSYGQITGGFSVTMPHNNTAAGWAAYDNWFDNWKYEVMIQHDFTRTPGDYYCDHVAIATFGGSNGVPVQGWGLCVYGSELIWQPVPAGAAVGSQSVVNIASGSVDIKAMTLWLVSHGYMTANPTITNLSYGFEIATTSGIPETWKVNSYSLLAQ